MSLTNIRNISDTPPFSPTEMASYVSNIEAKKFFRGIEGGFFGDVLTDFIEIAAYDAETQEIQDEFTSKSYKISERGRLLLPTYQHINNLNLRNERGYIIRYNFLRKVIYPSAPDNFQLLPTSNQQEILRKNLGNRVGMKLFIHEISNDRTEVRILPKVIGSAVVDVPLKETFVSFFSQDADGQSFDYVMNFGKSQLFHIVNWTIDRDTFPDFPNSVVLKLYEPLPETIKKNSEFWINKEVFPSYIDRIRYIETQPSNNLVYLRGPDFKATPESSDFRETGDKTWNDLLSSTEKTSDDLLTDLLSNTQKTANLNIDYSQFENFIKFSSAVERVENFKYKLGVYQNITKSIDTITSNASLSSSGSILNPQKRRKVQRLQNKRTSLREAFDGFETWVFNSPDIRDSNGDLLNIQNNTTVQTFFEDLSTSADFYDRNNPSALVNQLPEYIRADQRNEEFELFINMVSHYFDIIWTYIKHMEYIHDRKDDIKSPESLSADLSQFIANSFGYDVFNGFELEDAFEFLVNDSDQKYEGVQKEIWRRVLNNIPYLSKTKGTRRGVEALLSIYGIPKIGLSIREYGKNNNSPEQAIYQFIEDETNSLGFYGTNSIDVDWTFPGQNVSDMELRFKTEFNTTTSRIIDLDGILTVDIVPTSGNRGYLNVTLPNTGQSFTVGSSSDIPIYDGDWSSVSVSYNPSVTVKIGKRSPIPPEKINNANTPDPAWFAISSIVPGSGFATDYFSASTLHVGPSFNGDIDHVRVWKNKLSNDKFKEHVFAPLAYDKDNQSLVEGPSIGNPSITLNEDLWINVDFSDKNVENESPNESYTGTINASGYSPLEPDDFTPYLRENYIKPMKMGANIVSDSQIKTEKNNLLGSLSSTERRDIGSSTGEAFNQKFDVFFSPIKKLNEDITAGSGFKNVNSLLADPTDLYETDYRKLGLLNKKYWMKYPSSIDFNLYFKYIDQFNRAFFKQLKNITPARSNLTYGGLIEPHTLERYRAKTQRVSRKQLDDSVEIPVSDTVKLERGNDLFDDQTSFSVVDTITERGSLPMFMMEGGIDVDKYSTRTFRYAGNFLEETDFQTLQSPDLYPGDSYYVNGSFGLRNPDSYQRFRRVPFKQQIQFIFPIRDEYDYTHNNYFQVFGSSFTYNGNLVSTPLGELVPPEEPYARYRHYIFNREYRTATKRMKGISNLGVSALQSKTGLCSCGVLNWSGTTVDGGPAVVTKTTTSERLIVSPSDVDPGEGPIVDVG